MKRDEGRLHRDIMRNLTRHTAWEDVMRLRCSRGIDLVTLCCAIRNDSGLDITSFCEHFFVRSSYLQSLPTSGPDKAFAVEIKYDEMVFNGNVASLQCALFCTSSRVNGASGLHLHAMHHPETDCLQGSHSAISCVA